MVLSNTDSLEKIATIPNPVYQSLRGRYSSDKRIKFVLTGMDGEV